MFPSLLSERMDNEPLAWLVLETESGCLRSLAQKTGRRRVRVRWSEAL